MVAAAFEAVRHTAAVHTVEAHTAAESMVEAHTAAVAVPEACSLAAHMAEASAAQDCSETPEVFLADKQALPEAESADMRTRAPSAARFCMFGRLCK